MITVQILIAGLVAVVPRPDAHSVSLLFADSAAVSYEIHVPVIIGLENFSCTGDCVYPLTAKEVDTSTRLGKKLAEEMDGTDYSPLKRYSDIFFWLPVGKAMSVEPSNREAKIPYRIIGDEYSPSSIPRSQDEVASSDWVLRMEDLFPGRGIVDDDCLVLPRKCGSRSKSDSAKISAAFDAPLGTLGACRVVNRCGKIATFKIDGVNKEQSITDIAFVEISLPGDSVTFKMKCLNDSCYNKDVTLHAVAKKDPVSLLVANIPLCYGGSGHHEYFQWLSKGKLVIGKEPTLSLANVDSKHLTPATKICENFPLGFADESSTMRNRDREGIVFPIFPFIKPEAFINKPECSPVIFRN